MDSGSCSCTFYPPAGVIRNDGPSFLASLLPSNVDLFDRWSLLRISIRRRKEGEFLLWATVHKIIIKNFIIPLLSSWSRYLPSYQFLWEGECIQKEMNYHGKLIFLFLLIPGSLETTVKKWDLRFLELYDDYDMQKLVFYLGVEDALSLCWFFNYVLCVSSVLRVSLSLSGSSAQQAILFISYWPRVIFWWFLGR